MNKTHPQKPIFAARRLNTVLYRFVRLSSTAITGLKIRRPSLTRPNPTAERHNRTGVPEPDVGFLPILHRARLESQLGYRR